MPKIKSNPGRWPSKHRKRTKRTKNIIKSSVSNKTGRKSLQEAFNKVTEDDKAKKDRDLEKDEKEELINLEEFWCSDEEYESLLNTPLVIEKDQNPPPEFDFSKTIQGNRIVNLAYVLQWAIPLQYSKKCTMGMLYPFQEMSKGFGLVSHIEFRCTMCNEQIVHSTENPDTKSEINHGYVWGTLATGSTYAHTEELFSVMNIPPMNKYMYYKIEKDIEMVWHAQVWEEMEKAGREERELAIAKNNIDSDGIPYITVFLDGGWSKRSYGHNYNAASGVGVIIGKETGKALYIGVRNKYCCICARAANKTIDAKEHHCYKNWSGSSSAMEADIIVQGFRTSEEMHNLRYENFIADGDSSVFAKIKQEVPYSKFIRKTECTNHAVKNYTKGLYKIKADTKNINLTARKLLSKKVIDELGSLAQSAIYNCSVEQDVESLKKRIENGPRHVFGDHEKCEEFYCSTIEEKTNSQILDVKKCGLFHHIMAVVDNLVKKSTQLIDNETNNRAELFMSILARFNAGKRLNLTTRGSFETRCYISGLRFNKGIAWHSSPWKKTILKSPGKFCKKYIEKEESKLEKRREKIQSLPLHEKKKRAKFETKLPDNNYGLKAIQQALPEEELNLEKQRILNRLQINEIEQKEIAKLTVGQFNNPAYEVEKANRLTASFFGRVINKRNSTPCHNIVKDVLYKSNFMSPATEYGKSKESVAIKLFEEKTNLKVVASGLYIDIDHGFLGASPDGLIGNSSIVEVKCLYKASQNGWTLQEAAKSKQTCLRINEQNEIALKTNHTYYFQIQGQLNITRKDVCYFIVYINDQTDMHIEKIERNEQFWKENMLPKLKKFYLGCVLPEIINRNVPRGLKCVESS